MSRYRMDDGTVIDTDNATAHWDESRTHDGSNWISDATGSQWEHETLYRSRKGHYYVEHTSQWQGRRAHVEWVSPEEATRWLLAQGKEIPEELRKYLAEVSE